MMLINTISFVLAAAMLLRSEAFAPVSPVSRVSSKKFTLLASDKPLTELCEITKEACEAVAPMLNGKTIILILYHSLTPAYTICHSSTHIAFITSYRAILSD